MHLNILVLIKQVPDTAAVTDTAMNADGTLNRAGLPSVINPDDLHALETAFDIRDRFGASITAMTMGPPGAVEVLRQALYLGADRVVLLSDRRFAGADTLATSYVLSRAIEKLGSAEIVLCGRQAIDGNTAQVGPQVAEKLGINQITYVETIESIAGGKLRARRRVEEGRELVESLLPVLLTVPDSANTPRPMSIKKIMTYKAARAAHEIRSAELRSRLTERGLLIETLGVDEIGLDPARCGLSGSPTRVKKIESVVLKGADYRAVEPTPDGLRGMLQKLIADYTFD